MGNEREEGDGGCRDSCEPAFTIRNRSMEAATGETTARKEEKKKGGGGKARKESGGGEETRTRTRQTDRRTERDETEREVRLGVERSGKERGRKRREERRGEASSAKPRCERVARLSPRQKERFYLLVVIYRFPL